LADCASIHPDPARYFRITDPSLDQSFNLGNPSRCKPTPRSISTCNQHLATSARNPRKSFYCFRHLGTPCRLDRIQRASLPAGNSSLRLQSLQTLQPFHDGREVLTPMMLEQNVYRFGVSVYGCRDRGNQRRQIAGTLPAGWSALPRRPRQRIEQDPFDPRSQAHPGRLCRL
jgi:hypothetical protein